MTDDKAPTPMRLLQKQFEVPELNNDDLEEMEFDDPREKLFI